MGMIKSERRGRIKEVATSDLVSVHVRSQASRRPRCIFHSFVPYILRFPYGEQL